MYTMWYRHTWKAKSNIWIQAVEIKYYIFVYMRNNTKNPFNAVCVIFFHLSYCGMLFSFTSNEWIVWCVETNRQFYLWFFPSVLTFFLSHRYYSVRFEIFQLRFSFHIAIFSFSGAGIFIYFIFQMFRGLQKCLIY